MSTADPTPAATTAARAGCNSPATAPLADPAVPVRLDLDRARALTITWGDGQTSVFAVTWLRTHCPCASCKSEREARMTRPKTSLSVLSGTSGGGLSVLSVDQVGNYALRLHFSDGHSTGIFSFAYLFGLRDQSEAG